MLHGQVPARPIDVNPSGVGLVCNGGSGWAADVGDAMFGRGAITAGTVLAFAAPAVVFAPGSEPLGGAGEAGVIPGEGGAVGRPADGVRLDGVGMVGPLVVWASDDIDMPTVMVKSVALTHIRRFMKISNRNETRMRMAL